MSGGGFDYQQYHIRNIVEELEDIIERNGKEKPKVDLEPWEYYYNGDVYDDCKCYYMYSEDVINEFKKAVKILKTAYVYTERIDYLISGDDDEESFFKRLNDELKEI